MDIDREDDTFNMTSDPPEEVSPKHILNALNNDCIKEIFRRFNTIDDFLRAAEVCIQVQQNARQCFPSIYKVFYLSNQEHSWNNEVKPYLVLPLSRVQMFLGIFGDLIEKIAWGYPYESFPYINTFPPMRFNQGVKEDREYDENNLRILADHCGKTVKEMQIRGRFIDFNIMHKFQALEKLDIYLCGNIYVKTHKPGLFSKLKSLTMTRIFGQCADWLQKKFPNLIEAIFFTNFPGDQNTIIQFIKKNPQLQRLRLDISHLDTSNFWQAFDDISSSNLQYFYCGIQIHNEDDIKYLFPFFLI